MIYGGGKCSVWKASHTVIWASDKFPDLILCLCIFVPLVECVCVSLQVPSGSIIYCTGNSPQCLSKHIICALFHCLEKEPFRGSRWEYKLKGLKLLSFFCTFCFIPNNDVRPLLKEIFIRTESQSGGFFWSICWLKCRCTFRENGAHRLDALAGVWQISPGVCFYPVKRADSPLPCCRSSVL